MILIFHAYSQFDALNVFINRQIHQADLEDSLLTSWSIELNPSLVSHYNITRTQNIIFKNEIGDELHRIEGPFSSSELEAALQIAKSKNKRK